jgi:hypothetical protein
MGLSLRETESFSTITKKTKGWLFSSFVWFAQSAADFCAELCAGSTPEFGHVRQPIPGPVCLIRRECRKQIGNNSPPESRIAIPNPWFINASAVSDIGNKIGNPWEKSLAISRL